MAIRNTHWKKGRGKLGIFDPLLGSWEAQADSPLGSVRCTRTFTRVLNGTAVQLHAIWKMPESEYEEIAFYSADKDGLVRFWSFTSDGKQSQGRLADVTELHPEAVGFEADMPAGLARMAYWPDEESGFYWVVESKNKQGWKRFTEHHYTKIHHD